MIEEEIYQEYKTNLLLGERAFCTQVVKDLLINGIDIKHLYLDLFQRSLVEIGQLWEYNKISVSVEHLATSITGNLMNLAYPYILSSNKIGKKAVVACIANEYHQIGGKMIADFFEMNGWDSYFLGADNPKKDLISYIEDKKPDLLGLSLAIYSNLPLMEEIIKDVKGAFPELRIIVGGQAFKWGSADFLNSYQDVTYLDSLTNFENFIRNFKTRSIKLQT